MRYLLLLLCISMSCLANAQTKRAYTGSVEGGLLAGSSNPGSGFISTAQGVAFGQYRVGIGGGFDFYRVRSIPLYATASRSFTHKHTRPFAAAAAGLNIVSPTGSEKAQIFYYDYTGSYRNGFYAKVGGGLMFRAAKKWQLALLAGYTSKSTTYVYTRLARQPWPNETKPIEDKYHFNRWYVGVGISW